MSLSRRDLIRVAVLAPAGLAVAGAASLMGGIVAGAAPRLRPPASGTSATRCALCGGPDHTMLDPGCPAARRLI
jgi:hypothetical protein